MKNSISQVLDCAVPVSIDDFLDEYIRNSQDDATFQGSCCFESTKHSALPLGSALQRTRTISNVPIYVTQFEGSCESSEAGCDGGVATFVFSNL